MMNNSYNRVELEEEIIRKLKHVDPKDLHKIKSILYTLAKKFNASIEKRAKIEIELIHFESKIRNILNTD